jgi:FAD/FMN-containing dehydrogenase
MSEYITSEHLNALKNMVDKNGWDHADNGAQYFDDPRGRFHGNGQIILRPVSTKEVSQIVGYCNDQRLAIIPYGGGTGVVAGQLSIDDKNVIILSLERMNKVRELSIDDETITVDAGCILENIHTAAEDKNFIFPLSMASKGSCQIGGNLATNAGGLQVLRYGNARDLCLGIEAVLPDGSIYSDLNPLRKNNTGYDLRNLLIGSEGTLGIITAATLTLKPQPTEVLTSFCAVPNVKAALVVLKRLRAKLGDTVSAIELLSNIGLKIVSQHFDQCKSPLNTHSDWYLLIEVAGSRALQPDLETVLAGLFEEDYLKDVVIATSGAQREKIWQLRELMAEANKAEGAICSSDTAVPLSKISDFIDDTVSEVSKVHPELRINSYGHIGDGNIHHNVFPPLGESKVDFIKKNSDAVVDLRMAINEATASNTGSISAEHGVGRLKVDDLERYADPVKVRIMRQIKDALDPHNILNPGVLLK